MQGGRLCVKCVIKDRNCCQTLFFFFFCSHGFEFTVYKMWCESMYNSRFLPTAASLESLKRDFVNGTMRRFMLFLSVQDGNVPICIGSISYPKDTLKGKYFNVFKTTIFEIPMCDFLRTKLPDSQNKWVIYSFWKQGAVLTILKELCILGELLFSAKTTFKSARWHFPCCYAVYLCN